MAKLGVLAINYTGGGEPTLHPSFDSFSSRASHFGIKQGLFTNAISRGHPANPKLFEWIRISLTDKYIEAIDPLLIANYIQHTTVGISLNVTPENIDRAEELCKQARDLGVHYFQVRPALVNNYKQQPDIDIPYYLQDYETKDFKVYLSEYKFAECRKPKTYTQCYAGHFTPVIDYNGNVRVCNYHMKEDEYIIGNLKNNSFSSIINSIPLSLPVNNTCLTCCKNHEINKTLNAIREIKHPEFI